MRLVLDTSVVASAVRNPSGASAELLASGLEGRFCILISVPLIFEYEDVLMRPDQLEASALRRDEVDQLLAAILRQGEQVQLGPYHEPASSDPGDNHILSLAKYGRGDGIVTFNRRHFLEPSARLGVDLWTPIETLRLLRNR